MIKSHFFIFFLISFVFIYSTNLHAKEKFVFSLEECIKKALDVDYELETAPMSMKNHEKKLNEADKVNGLKNKKREIVYKIKTLYYDFLLKRELIKLTKDVKNNFEKAADKAEKKLESEDPDITVQDVLKLKLGLVGSKDELNHLEHDRKVIIHSLKLEMGIPLKNDFDLIAKKLKKEKFELKNIQDYFDSVFTNKSSKNNKEARISIIKIYNKIQEAEESIKNARQARKISRSLLVTNLANFDFGIGEAKDLFESLFIYMRSVKNYMKKIHDYNVSIAELSFETGRELSDLVY